MVAYYLDSKQGTKKCASVIPDGFTQGIKNIDMVLTNQGTVTIAISSVSNFGISIDSLEGNP
jgi:hypothetical protein